MANVPDDTIITWLDEQCAPEDEEATVGEMASDVDYYETEVSDHDTESEQEGDESEVLQVSSENNLPFVVGKDNITKWFLHAPSQNSMMRTRRHNIVNERCGLVGEARNANSILDAWKLFFPNETINYIVTCTNKYLAKIRPNYTRDRNCKDTNEDEILALFSLLYLGGVMKSSHVNLDDLWQKNITTPPCFRMGMSLARFKILLRGLRFDDIDTREERKRLDKLAPIRELFEGFVQQCTNSYKPGPNCTIDEMLEGFFGRCPIKQYIPSKPNKYGIKIFSLVDSASYFTIKMEIYAGKQPAGPFELDNTPSEVVKRLIQPIDNSGRNITCDNWFSSVNLARDLLVNHRITIVGTVRKNKRELPNMLAQTKKMPPKSSMFVFADKCTVVSYVPKPNKYVLLVSTMHEGDTIDPASGDNNKPEIVTYYNSTKGGVDVVDQKKSLYSVGRICNRWPLRILYTLLDIAGINSQIVYQMNTGNIISRRLFLKQLSQDLIRRHLSERLTNPRLHPELKKLIKAELGVEEEARPHQAAVDREKCAFCPRKMNRKTKVRCVKCAVAICGQHTYTICTNCNDNNDASDYDD